MGGWGDGTRSGGASRSLTVRADAAPVLRPFQRAGNACRRCRRYVRGVVRKSWTLMSWADDGGISIPDCRSLLHVRTPLVPLYSWPSYSMYRTRRRSYPSQTLQLCIIAFRISRATG